jgi:hypothetical protein
MPKRVIDADAMWASSKLANCKQRSIPEYAWLYGLADANGIFELTNLRAVHGKAYAAIRPLISLDDLREFLEDFHRNGLLYRWTENGKLFGYWTGSEKPGRLPPASQRDHYPTNKVQHYPTEQDVMEYWRSLEESAAAQGRLYEPDYQPPPGPAPDLPPDAPPTPNGSKAIEVQVAAEFSVSERLKLASERTLGFGDTLGSETLWLEFYELWPAHLRKDMGAASTYSTRAKNIFLHLGLIEQHQAVEQLRLYLRYSQQHPDFIWQTPVNFLSDDNYKLPPREYRHAKRAPLGGTAEEKLARTIRRSQIRASLNRQDGDKTGD